MATYKEKVGTAVQSFDNDPDNPIVGQLWYNKTAAEFRYQEQAYGNAWSSGGNMNSAKIFPGGAGTQTAGLAFGAFNPSTSGATELYNGSSWTELNDLNTARGRSGSNGTSTSALGYGGADPSISKETESWNGTSWTEVNDLNTARRHMRFTRSYNKHRILEWK